jgi:predicted DNA-binding antitoxin AbrB/MazE fold protein
MATFTRNKNKGADAMGGTIRARVRHGVLEPMKKIELPEGKEVTVTILDVPGGSDAEAFRRSAGGWKGTIDAAKLIRDIYAGRLVRTRPRPRL